MSIPLNIGSRRELFWDEYLVDKSKTSASRYLHKPEKREIAITHDKPWESGDTIYHNIIKDDDIYRLYYLAWRKIEGDIKDYDPYPMVICYAQSRDGIIWKSLLLEFVNLRDQEITILFLITQLQDGIILRFLLIAILIARHLKNTRESEAHILKMLLKGMISSQ